VSPTCAIVGRPGEISAANMWRLKAWANQMDKEATPLWVWLSVALLAIGAVTYAITVFFVEHIMALF
jgi:membrane protein YdbS with pleckstrin-like domain